MDFNTDHLGKKLGIIKRITQKMHILWMDMIGLALMINDNITAKMYKEDGKPSFPSKFRFFGLEYILDKAKGMSILDVGVHDGLIAYEFARRGSRLVHGIDKRLDSIGFCRRLFRQAPCESEFFYADVTKGIPQKLDTYDIVLLLSIYYWLKKQMTQKDLEDLIRKLFRKSKHWFAAKGNFLEEIEPIARSEGFVERFKREEHPLVCVYERVK